ncbi:MAG: transglutaminase-like domain-containing protein [Candidatus Shapirobacteria bacterium]|nr:transglutaminase-like domain-containing protein [Candidatus Shapirobacteria bacterium]
MLKLAKNIKINLCLVFLIFFLAVWPVFGQEEFTISQEINYQLNEQGHCLVLQQVNMVNNFSSIYATEYTLSITGAQLIKNITATSQEKQLRTAVDRSNRNLTQITVFFEPPVTGKNKSNQFTISYQVDNFVENVGQTKRVVIPKISDIGRLDETKLTITAPKNFGPPSFISPKNFQETTNNDQIIISFNQADLFEKEVMAIFGDIQSMQFNLKYFLENPTSQAVEKVIALPPDTSYQKVFLTDLEPQPEKIIIDDDGNWLAYYFLDPQEDLTIEARGVVQITAEPQSPPLMPTDFFAYLGQDHFWEVNDPKITGLAKKLTTVDQIYRYVVNNLEYDLDRIKNRQAVRQGALGALENPNQAICTEFTDLFVALARAAGIPAREINGYAYSANPQMLPSSLYADVLHSWPEYWDSQINTWRQVDPTWESTSNVDYFNKMDMVHLAFVIHGQSSQLPLPAGAYQKENQHQKSVNIAFSQAPLDLSVKEFDIDWNLSKEAAIGKGFSGEIIINNPNNRAFYQIEVEFIGEGVGLNPKKTTIEALPPLGQAKIPLTIFSQSFWNRGNNQLIVKASTNHFNTQKTVSLPTISLISWQTLTTYWYLILPTVILLTTIGFFLSKKIKNG